METGTGSHRRLGRTDIMVSTVAAGCWAIVGDSTWGAQDETDALNALRVAHECGITFFDTAEGYGAGYSEELVARALGGVRDEIVIGSKVSPGHAVSWDRLRESCEASLRRLRTDRIEVYHLHWPQRDVPVADIISWFERLHAEGKIGCFAISNFGRQDLTNLLEAGRCEVNQLPYSLLWRVIEKEIVPLCTRHDISVTCYSPLAQGLLAGKFATADEVPEGRARTRHFSGTRPQARHGEDGCESRTFAALGRIREIAADTGVRMGQLALAWLLHQPGVASVLVGVRNPRQARDNAAAMQVALTPETCQRLASATDELNRIFGLNPDMWQSESRYR